MIAFSIILSTFFVLLGGYFIYRQITERLVVIHDLVNSNLTKVQADLQIALDRIGILEGHLAKK